MSSSRSDGVTNFVRVLVPKEFFKPKEARKFQRCFEEVSRVFQGSFKDISTKFQGCLTEVSRVYQESFMDVSRKFQGCFKKVLRVFQGCFK